MTSECDCCCKALKHPLQCGRCKAKVYCSSDCQKKAWKGSNGHRKTCFADDWVSKFWQFIEQSYHEDRALTEEEYKWYPVFVNRQASSILTHLGDQCRGTPLEAFKGDTSAGVKLACLYFLDRRLLPTGRGVRIKATNQIGYVVEHIGSTMSPKRAFSVAVAGSSSDSRNPPPTKKCSIDELRMLPLNDMRHHKDSLYFDEDTVPPCDKAIHPYDAMLAEVSNKKNPGGEGLLWEYQKEGTQEWASFHSYLQHELESLYELGSPHFLYRPNAPHCIGMYVSSPDSEDTLVGDPAQALQHDSSTRQVVFVHDKGDGMFYERDFMSGMKRLVRRRGPAVPFEDYQLRQRRHSAVPQNVLILPKKRYCGLCHSTKKRLVRMECCGGFVCDTEDTYQMNSYKREGQCARNHRLNSICFWHFQEGHGKGDWKACQKCKDDFSSYDYSVKATSMSASGTMRRYNFDDNVRTDIDVTTADFPVCEVCQQPVDTTEETTRTLSMRKIMGGGRVLCSHHGGGFGRINTEGFFSS